jgi:hypothetical protein
LTLNVDWKSNIFGFLTLNVDWKSNIIGFLTLNVCSKSNFFGFLEFDLVGCSIIHPIQNPEKSWFPNTLG